MEDEATTAAKTLADDIRSTLIEFFSREETISKDEFIRQVCCSYTNYEICIETIKEKESYETTL